MDAAREFEVQELGGEPSPDGVARWWVYILELEDGRYYVGAASGLRVRMSQHSACSSTFLTVDYRPICLVWAFRIEEELARSMECAITDQYLEEVSPHRVRGGGYVHAWDQVEHVRWLKPRPSWNWDPPRN
jgi:predicted GIY-YIG superfamily endonuclease